MSSVRRASRRRSPRSRSSTRSTSVANLSEQDVLKIRANLDQQRLTLADLLKVPVDVGLQDESDFPHRGTLEYVSPGIDPATGTLLVRGVLANPDRDLLPGFFVRMRLPMESVDAQRAAGARPGTAGRPGRPLSAGRQQATMCREALCPARRSCSAACGSITSGLNADDRVVVGELWRATPGHQGRAAADRDSRTARRVREP